MVVFFDPRKLICLAGIVSENQKLSNLKILKIGNIWASRGAGLRPGRESGRAYPRHFSGVRPPCALAALRARAADLARKRSIWPRGRVTQSSPIHSSFTPLIGWALKLVRLTKVADFPRSIVFR